MNALANPELGQFINEHFISAFQKVGTFRIVGQQKQGGNVASYFCAQDGRVLHVVAGPVSAKTLLKEAKWVVDTAKVAIEINQKSGKSIKSHFRQAHAERLRKDYGLMVEAITFDAPSQSDSGALTFNDPTGKILAPRLPAPPIQGPDVSFDSAELAAFNARQDAAIAEAEAIDLVPCQRGRVCKTVRLGNQGGGLGRGCFAIGNQGRVHQIMAAHSMKKIETIYGTIFEGILGEQVSTKPVIVKNPFPWIARTNNALQGGR